jgi:hypothetical protein
MATDDECESSDESLLDILSDMGSHSTAHRVDFDDNNFNINPPPTWDFMTNAATWHTLWYTMDELKDDRICYCVKDREVKILAGAKALFRAKAIALECNNYDARRPKTCGQ